MATGIGHGDVGRLVESQAAVLIEVLDESAFEKLHIPGAINIPLEDVDAETTGSLDRGRPVVVYCYDSQ